MVRALLQILDGTMVVAPPSRRLLFASDPATEVLARQLCGGGPVRAYHPDGRPLPAAEWPLLRTLQTGEPTASGPFDLMRPDGAWSTVDATAVPVQDSAGQMAAVAMIVRDATQRRNARLFLDTVCGIVDAVDAVGDAGNGVQQILAAAGGRLGWEAAVLWTPTAEGQGLSVGAEWTASGAVLADNGAALAERAWDRGGTVIETPGTLGVPVRVTGLTVAVLAVFSLAARAPDPDLLHFVECVADALGQLHRWQTIDRAFQQASARLQALMESAPVPVNLFDSSGRILEWSRAAEVLYGWMRSEMVGQPLFETPFVPPSERPNTQIQLDQVVGRGEAIQGAIVKRQRRDGGSLDVSLHLAPMVDAGGHAEGLVAVDLDVTERIRFLEIAVHEIRNPLTSIKGIVSLIRRSAADGKSAADLDPLLHVVEGEVDRLAGVVDEVIDGFRTAAGELELHPRPVDLAAVVAASLRPFAAAEGERFGLEETAPAPVLADPRRLEDVIRNLLENARKYSPPDSRIHVAVSVTGDRVRVTVRDSGIGIPADELERIFAPFYRASNVGPAHSSGLGLGLYRCQSIVKQHGGRIWAENRPEGGAEFSVELPLRSGS